MISHSPDALLTRGATADALTENGYPMKPATLATKATRGGGPPYRRFGAVALYRWGEALQWAQSRLSAPIRSTSELDLQRTNESPHCGQNAAGAKADQFERSAASPFISSRPGKERAQGLSGRRKRSVFGADHYEDL
jgi:hypothetical protein